MIRKTTVVTGRTSAEEVEVHVLLLLLLDGSGLRRALRRVAAAAARRRAGRRGERLGVLDELLDVLDLLGATRKT